MDLFECMEKESVYVYRDQEGSGDITDDEREIYNNYRQEIYRSHRIKLSGFSEINLAANRRRIYFHESRFIPHFRGHKYEMQTVNGHTISDILMRIGDDSYIFISVRDDGSQALNDEILDELRKIGITALNRTCLRHSYIWIAHKNKSGSYRVIYEACSSEPLEISSDSLGDQHAYQVVSKGALAGNYASVRIDGVEHSPNKRGMNIVEWNQISGAITSYCVDTFATVHGPDSLYTAVPPRYSAPSAWKQDFTVFQALGQNDPMESLELPIKNGFRIFELSLEHPPADMIRLMNDHPDVRIILDTQHTQIDSIAGHIRCIHNEALTAGVEDAMLRIMPQLHSESMYEIVNDAYPFAAYIYMISQADSANEAVLQFAISKGIGAVAMTVNRYSKSFAQELKRNGIAAAVYAVDSPETCRQWLTGSVKGIFTKYPLAEPFRLLRLEQQIALRVKCDSLMEFLCIRFGISHDDPVMAIIRKIEDSEQLTHLASTLYLAQSTEEVRRGLNAEMPQEQL
ncbi:interleukin-like EMT inducer domain-containing protein [Paenibacillus sedimenti]|uniref:ILEI/PANDER domain-containing protein n=1 Tax=Paenibacillus sedimenti TaxID=2770274 RepID=A0A926KT63_9BACL|nr:interleukin-like EMT inducer domain-containing protein [Paenibacillus sedimenti]MBD0382461.1 hypothetical protein [Paenibacillus sedimenti]